MTINEADRINARLTDEARAGLRNRVNLDLFLSLSPEHRAIAWRQWDASTKADAIIQQLGRLGYDWTEACVAERIAHYDAKYSDTDQLVPTAAEIEAAAKDAFDRAVQTGDQAAVVQLSRLRINIARGARLTWSLGDLLIQSVNNAGQVYTVSQRGCSCPNGQAGKAQCWHLALRELLEDMRDERAADADDRADAAQLGRRLCEARARYLDAA